MNDRELMERDATSNILAVCQWASPTSREQAAFAQLYNEMLMANESYSAVIIALASALIDGLQHGNWPNA